MPENSKRLSVLVVEDESLIRWSIAETLAEIGHTVVEASDAATAMQAVNETSKPFDVVLLDYRLPGSNDLNLLTNIRRRSPRSAVVLMTAFGTPEIIKGALELGVCRVLNKPFEIHEIGTIVLAASGR